ncbi:Yip1p like integral membrane protein [Cryptosporidium canis]|nr:Yip1p like integral membrane protein [Cryptosporidium canis]
MEQQANGFGARYGGAQGSSNPNSLQFYTMSKLRQEDGDDRTASVLGGFSGTAGNNAAFKGVNSYSNYNYHASDVGIGGTSNMPSSSFPGGDTCVAGPRVIPSSQHPGPSSGFGSSASAGSNIPRKSPFDIGEPGGQFGGGRSDSGPGNPGAPGYPGDGFGGGVPLGPMSASGPQSCGGVGRELSGSADSLQGAKASSFSSLTGLIRLLNPSLLWSTGQYGPSSAAAAAGDYRGGHQQGGSEEDLDDILNEPPLLEELGIDPENIARYLKRSEPPD